MSRCEQELCPNWTGDGDVCACSLYGLEKPRQCPECGQVEGMRHSMWDGDYCLICQWEENPL